MNRAPTAAKAGAMLYEVHSLVEFVGGILVPDVSFGFIDLDDNLPGLGLAINEDSLKQNFEIIE